MAIAFVKTGGVNADKVGGNATIVGDRPRWRARGLETWSLSPAAGVLGGDLDGHDRRQQGEHVHGSRAWHRRPRYRGSVIRRLGFGYRACWPATRSRSTLRRRRRSLRSAMSVMEFSGATITEDVASVSPRCRGTTPSVGPITPPSAAVLLLGGVYSNGANTITQDADTVGGAAGCSGRSRRRRAAPAPATPFSGLQLQDHGLVGGADV